MRTLCAVAITLFLIGNMSLIAATDGQGSEVQATTETDAITERKTIFGIEAGVNGGGSAAFGLMAGRKLSDKTEVRINLQRGRFSSGIFGIDDSTNILSLEIARQIRKKNRSANLFLLQGQFWGLIGGGIYRQSIDVSDLFGQVSSVTSTDLGLSAGGAWSLELSPRFQLVVNNRLHLRLGEQTGFRSNWAYMWTVGGNYDVFN